MLEFKLMLKILSTTKQDTVERLAAITTMVGLPFFTGILSVLGTGPVVVITVAWLLPMGGLMGWRGRQM